MRIVVADTGPLNYLLLIGEIELLPQLFEAVHIPDVVSFELTDDRAPTVVRGWASAPPAWLVVDPTPPQTKSLPKLDAGEQAALTLAAELKAELVLIDDRAATKVARAQGFVVIGTLGILVRAAGGDLVDLRIALARLAMTNFRIQPDLIAALLAEYPPHQ